MNDETDIWHLKHNKTCLKCKHFYAIWNQNKWHFECGEGAYNDADLCNDYSPFDGE